MSGPQGREGLVIDRQNASGVGQQLVTARRQLKRTGVSDEEISLELSFQFLNLLANGGLNTAQLLGGFGEAFKLCYRDKRAELIHV